jgi:hypothetical protein
MLIIYIFINFKIILKVEALLATNGNVEEAIDSLFGMVDKIKPKEEKKKKEDFKEVN